MYQGNHEGDFSTIRNSDRWNRLWSKSYSHFLRRSSKHGTDDHFEYYQIDYSKKNIRNISHTQKKELWGGAFWSVGKYIGTVGEATNEKVVKRYIRNQSIDTSESDNRIEQLKLFKIWLDLGASTRYPVRLRRGDSFKFFLGSGAPVTEAFAQKIGADGYSEDAFGAVELVRRLLSI